MRAVVAISTGRLKLLRASRFDTGVSGSYSNRVQGRRRNKREIHPVVRRVVAVNWKNTAGTVSEHSIDTTHPILQRMQEA